MFTVEMLPAAHGDCLWVEYGDREKLHRVLIDGGTAATFDVLAARICRLPRGQRRFDLLIVSHVDADHIQGIVKLFQAKSLGVKFDDIWFNGWKHLSNLLSPVEGEFLSALLEMGDYNWNHAFDEGPVVAILDPDPPLIKLAGGMRVTVLSPTLVQLDRLRAKWDKLVRQAGLLPGSNTDALEKLRRTKRLLPPELLGAPKLDVRMLAAKTFVGDTAVANGSSIAILGEFEGKSCLFAADAYASVLIQSIRCLLNRRGEKKLEIGALKLSHHGSRANTSIDLLRLLQCKRYLFSTDGKIFNHPDPETVARVIAHGGEMPQLLFNYRTSTNDCWDNPELSSPYVYGSRYPRTGQKGLVVRL